MEMSRYDENRQLKNVIIETCFQDDDWKTHHDDGTLGKMKVYKRKAS